MIIETETELNSEEICKCKFFTFTGVHLAKVVKCYDGDTIHCIFKIDGNYHKFKIRMDGYDSAEMKPSLKLDPTIRKELKEKALLAKQNLDGVKSKRVWFDSRCRSEQTLFCAVPFELIPGGISEPLFNYESDIKLPLFGEQ